MTHPKTSLSRREQYLQSYRHADDPLKSKRLTLSYSDSRIDRRQLSPAVKRPVFKASVPEPAVALKKHQQAGPSETEMAVPPIRASQVLREILTKNPRVKTFTVSQIIDSVSDNRVGTSLMFFSIPAMIEVPGTSNLVGIPTGVIAGQMMIGRTEIKLPKFILDRPVPRRSLAVAIHTILPILEKVEKLTKPRWHWVRHPLAQRILGLLVFLLTVAIALPIIGFNLPHAVAMFIISLGMVEQDGLAILAGVVIGITSLVLLTGVNISAKKIRARICSSLKQICESFSFKWVMRLLAKISWLWAKEKLSNLKWFVLLLLGDPEAAARRRAQNSRFPRAEIRQNSCEMRNLTEAQPA